MSCAKSQYDGFCHFVASLNPPRSTVFAMINSTIYFDDSGTHPESEMAVASCYIGHVEQWNELCRNWNEANEKEEFGTFHMADFVANKAQFKAPVWADKRKRDRTIMRLINIIRTRAEYGFSACIVKDAYDKHILADPVLVRKSYKNHYSAAIHMCMAHIDEWRTKRNREEPIQYIFDQLSKGRGEIDAMFQTVMLGGSDGLKRYGVYGKKLRDGWSFQDKESVVPLQAADIWAYENYRYMRDIVIPNSGSAPRQSFLALSKLPHRVVYQNHRSMAEFARQRKAYLLSKYPELAQGI
jgi:hypothetical protein